MHKSTFLTLTFFFGIMAWMLGSCAPKTATVVESPPTRVVVVKKHPRRVVVVNRHHRRGRVVVLR